jgi:hypothetical protein
MDTFTDANDTPLAAHSPDIGGFTWRRIEDFGPYSPVIRGNSVGVDGADTLDGQFHYMAPEIIGQDTVELEIQVGNDLIHMGGPISVWITLRADGAPQGGYHFWMESWGGLQRTFVGFQRNAQRFPNDNSQTEIPPLTPGNHKLRAEASGGSLKIYLDGLLLASASDPSPLPAGSPGFGLLTGIVGSQHDSQIRVTTFEVKPCPPIGDPVLESKAVRDGLIAGLSASGPNLPFLQRKEHGGIIYRMPDGSYFVEDIPNQLQGAAVTCRYLLGPSNGPPGGIQVAVWHTHPHLTNDTAYNCTQADPVSGAVPYIVDPSLNGGGSDADWEATTPDFPHVYVINSLGEIIRLDYGVPKGKPRVENKNRWTIGMDGRSCLKKKA